MEDPKILPYALMKKYEHIIGHVIRISHVDRSGSTIEMLYSTGNPKGGKASSSQNKGQR